MEKFESLSYRRHTNHHEQGNVAVNKMAWARKDTVDYWRHQRMYNSLDTILTAYPESEWLTVGDGRYGTDANYILNKGVKKVLATDISDTYLFEAKKEGFINEYKIENVENLSFSDLSFDFVLCKEAYHHFPRPMVALYEMLRVARKGIILIEPQDKNILIPSKFGVASMLIQGKQVLKNFIKNFLRKSIYYEYGGYETVGNYIYTISEREIEKVALGLNYAFIAFKSIADSYKEGVEFEVKTDDSPLFKQLQSEIKKTEKRIKKGIPSDLLVAIIFKKKPDDDFRSNLKKQGFNTYDLPRNPYLTT